MEERRNGGGGSIGDGGGAGGKLTRRTFRTRTSSTPYDRPPLARKMESGWFSKLVLQPASKILPSLFTTAKIQDPLPPPQPEALPELEREDYNAESTLIFDEPGPSTRTGEPGPSTRTGEPGPSARTDQPEADFKVRELVGDKSGNTCDDNGLADIEQRLKQKKLSTDEINRLIELLRSRTIDLPEDDDYAARFIPEAPEIVPGQRNPRTTKEEHPVHRNWKTSDPLPFTAHDVGSSPIDIAKAYMEGLTSPSGYDCQSGRLKNESVFCSDRSISKLPFTSGTKSSICWPGAVVQSDRGYFTPQRGRTGLGPRTPYSGAIFSKSSSKFQANCERAESSSAVWTQSSTPLFGSTKKLSRRTNNNLDNGFTSGGPVRHVRPKNMTTTAWTGASPSSPATTFPFLPKRSDASIAGGNLESSSSKGGFYSVQSIDVDEEATKFASGPLTVHPQSSKMAQKIFEHLNRTVPSPKEKSSELKLAIARTRSPPNLSTLLKDDHDDRNVIRISEEQKTSCLLRQDMVAQNGANTKKDLSGPSASISNDKDELPSPLQTDKQAIFRQVQKAANSEASHSSQENLVPAAKPENKLSSSDNGISFTFPVTFASNAFSEPPPTPTMTSKVVASKTLDISRESIPSFKFGSPRSDNRLVFSFSSSSSDTTAPVFKFGTESKPTLSFKPVGKDAFCC